MDQAVDAPEPETPGCLDGRVAPAMGGGGLQWLERGVGL